MTEHASLQRRLVLWLVVFASGVALMLFVVGGHVHEHAEHAAWRSLLDSELHAIERNHAEDPDYRWQDSDTLRLFPLDGETAAPAALRDLHDGLHDNVRVNGRLSAVMVRHTQALGRLALVLDIEDFHELEQFAERWSVIAGLLLIVFTGLAAWLGIGRLVRPLSSLARDIRALRPGQPGQCVVVGRGGSSELHVIANALNDYLQRNQQFVERERVFVSTASHELRTPLAVITGAVELALEQPDVPARAQLQLQRIQRTARAVEELVQLLLMLARDPQRLARHAEQLSLEHVLEQVVEDHRHLTVGKQLTLEHAGFPSCVIVAPAGVVHAAIGNLLRNAIENSDRGAVHIALSADAVVTIDDPGHGMSPEEISAIHARLARGGDGAAEAGGIGLELIARLCEHLGWQLHISARERGTRVTLDMGASRYAPSHAR